MISDPERCLASTTTVIADSAAMIRLRAGKVQRLGVVPGGSSLSTSPRSTMRSYRRPRLAGVAVSAPPPRTAIVRPRPASSAPSWARESMPRAMPLTTIAPAEASSRPSPSASSRP